MSTLRATSTHEDFCNGKAHMLGDGTRKRRIRKMIMYVWGGRYRYLFTYGPEGCFLPDGIMRVVRTMDDLKMDGRTDGRMGWAAGLTSGWIGWMGWMYGGPCAGLLFFLFSVSLLLPFFSASYSPFFSPPSCWTWSWTWIHNFTCLFFARDSGRGACRYLL